MSKIYAEINESQQLLRLTYKRLEALARDLNEDGLDEDFTSVLTKKLGYSSALDRYRPLSITDILIRLLALKEPRVNAQNIVSSLEVIFNDSRYKKYVASMRRKQKQPFENYLRVRGMESSVRQLNGGQATGVEWSIRKGFPMEDEVFFTRMAVLEFALNYGRSISDPNGFSPYYLQTSADKLNSRLQPIVDALNQDIQDMFVEPTLEQIELIAREVGGVDYARVGRTTVAGLSGMKSEVLANTVSVSDTSQPLRLSTLLAKTSELAEKSNNLFPVPAGASPSSVPVSTALGLLGALSEDRTLWRELTAGTSLKIMPFVLRDSTSAELHIDLTVSAQSGTVEQKVRPLSQVSQNNINTTVYVGALDLFALSTFTEQSTVDGGRTYVPVIGTIWEGLFSGVPVFGDLFSWKNSPKTIYHQSLVLSNTLINPTAMGLALLYPRDSPGSESEGDFKARFKAQCKAVTVFKDSESRKLNAMRNSSSKHSASSTPLGCEHFNKEFTSSQVSGQAETSP